MNVIEAATKGKVIRRSSWAKDDYLEVKQNNILPLRLSDIVADDWEVDGPEVSITKCQLLNAVKRTFDHPDVDTLAVPFEEQLAEELGL